MEFQLPAIGEGVTEGEIVRWLVKEGDAVAVDQPLVEIMTDKATVEIPSPHAGKVGKFHVKPGELVKVGQNLVTIEEGAATSAARPPAPRPTAPAPAQHQPQPRPQAAAPAPRPTPQPIRPAAAAPAPSPAPRMSIPGAQTSVAQAEPYIASPGNVLATPATRRLARDLGVDLNQIQGSGPSGRVTKEDVQRFTGAVSGGPAVPAPQLRGPAPAPRRAPAVPGERETLVPLRGIRRKISEAMTRSRTTIPEFTYVDECDISELVKFRAEAKPIAEKQGIKLTYMPFIMKACIRALREFPYMNAALDEQGGNIVLKNYFNIGVAIDTEDGLVVPVVKNADQKSILELAAEIQSLAEKARTRKLSPEDLKDGTFSITNAGNIGGLLATPIINWPEVAILGVHKISRRPIVKTAADGSEQIAIADMIWLSVAIDHRVVDGAMGARFMNVVMDYLSNPKKMMLDMA